MYLLLQMPANRQAAAQQQRRRDNSDKSKRFHNDSRKMTLLAPQNRETQPVNTNTDETTLNNATHFIVPPPN